MLTRFLSLGVKKTTEKINKANCIYTLLKERDIPIEL